MINTLKDYSKYSVGVFDSGKGGEYVALQLKKQFPKIKIISLSDQKNIPYGNKTPAQMLKCIKPFIEQFNQQKVDVILIACNICYINLKDHLPKLTSIKLIGYLPALEMAVKHSSSGNIMTCATKGTLDSIQWQNFKKYYSQKYTLIDVDCTNWVSLIEQSIMTKEILNALVQKIVSYKVDSLVLGCTHYNWIRQDIENLLPSEYRLQFFEATDSVFQKLSKILV